jgi:hypothetical protein
MSFWSASSPVRPFSAAKLMTIRPPDDRRGDDLGLIFRRDMSGGTAILNL